MPEKQIQRSQPKGFSRLLWRMPIGLYHIGLGWMMTNRLMLLTHTGRKSGLQRQAVIEVVRHDRAGGCYIAASGFGKKSDWYQNVMAHPQVIIQVGTKKMEMLAQQLPPDEALQEIRDYGKRHPAALRTLAGFLGIPHVDSEEGYQRIIQAMPIVRFCPSQPEKEG